MKPLNDLAKLIDEDERQRHFNTNVENTSIKRCSRIGPMTRDQAIEIRARVREAKPQSYYAEPFEPHEWVVDAMIRAGNTMQNDHDGARSFAAGE